MIKLLTREGMFCLLRGEQQQHRDVHKHFFRQLAQQLPDFGLAFDAAHTLKIWVNNSEADGDGIVPTSFNLHLLVGAFVLRQDVQDLLDLYVRFCTAIYSSHNYNRPSAPIMFRLPHPKRLSPHVR
jgi:hypothetical protein